MIWPTGRANEKGGEDMEVELKPGVPGCVFLPLAVISLGLVPLAMRLGERHFIARMDDDGFVTRGGTRIAWREVTGVQRVVGKVKGVALSDEFQLRTARGKASLPVWRARNGEEAMNYLLARLPGELLS